MSEQVTRCLDDQLAAGARDAAVDAGSSLEDWAKAAMRHQLALATARRARQEEDARDGLYFAEQEEVLVESRMTRAVAAFDRADEPADR